MSLILEKQKLTPQQLAILDSEFEAKAKNKTVVVLLWLFFALLGAHRFYLGNTGYAVAMLLLGWLTFGIWPVIDIFFALKETERKNEQIQRDLINRVKAYAGN